MQYEEKYGKTLFECALTPGKALRKRLLYLLGAIIFIIAGIAVLLSPELLEGEEEYVKTLLPVLFFGVGSIFVIFAIIRVKMSKAMIYERGFVHIIGSKAIEVDFNDIKGIRDLIEKEMWFAAIIPVFASKNRTFTIVKKDDTPIILKKNNVSDLNQFADTFNAVFTDILLRGVTKENLNNVNISFGEELELSNGQLVFDEGKKGTTNIDFSQILDIENSDTGHHILLIGEGEKKALKRTDILAIFSVEKALNIDAFYRILQMAKES